MAAKPGGSGMLNQAHNVDVYKSGKEASRQSVLRLPCVCAEEAARAVKEPAMEYRMDPNRQPRFIIRSCFGGTNAAFVASGSEVKALSCLVTVETVFQSVKHPYNGGAPLH